MTDEKREQIVCPRCNAEDYQTKGHNLWCDWNGISTEDQEWMDAPMGPPRSSTPDQPQDEQATWRIEAVEHWPDGRPRTYRVMRLEGPAQSRTYLCLLREDADWLVALVAENKVLKRDEYVDIAVRRSLTTTEASKDLAAAIARAERAEAALRRVIYDRGYCRDCRREPGHGHTDICRLREPAKVLEENSRPWETGGMQ